MESPSEIPIGSANPRRRIAELSLRINIFFAYPSIPAEPAAWLALCEKLIPSSLPPTLSECALFEVPPELRVKLAENGRNLGCGDSLSKFDFPSACSGVNFGGVFHRLSFSDSKYTRSSWKRSKKKKKRKYKRASKRVTSQLKPPGEMDSKRTYRRENEKEGIETAALLIMKVMLTRSHDASLTASPNRFRRIPVCIEERNNCRV